MFRINSCQLKLHSTKDKKSIWVTVGQKSIWFTVFFLSSMAWRIQYIEDIRDNKRSYHLNTWLVHLWVQSCFIKLPSFGPSLELIFVDENVSNLNYVYAHIAHIEYPMIFITSFRVSFFFNLKTMFSSYFVYSYRIRATVMHMHP